MKSYFSIFLVLVTFSVQSQELEVIPPGTIQLSDSLYIDKGPVDNAMYREFTNGVLKLWNLTLHDSLKGLKLEDIDKSLSSTPLDPVQSIKIYNKVSLHESIEINDKIDLYQYLNHPKYQFHPVITVSKEQAEMFCKWRTDMVNLLWSTKLKNGTRNYRKIKYRLPTIEEYELAKKTFLDKDQLLLIDETSPLKINVKAPIKNDNFIISKTPEFTASNKKFTGNPLEVESSNPSDKTFTFFRCICEVE